MTARLGTAARLTQAVLVDAVRKGLAARADPAKAPQMQAYMKSPMPYRGVPTPTLRMICREAFRVPRLATFAAWRATALELWRGAAYREERYAAIELCGHRFYRDFQTLAALPLYEEMVVTGAWWDYVDGIASHRLGELLRRFPAPMTKAMRAWARSEDLWKRRSAILCQLSFKRATDLDLLYDSVECAMDEPEFFLRKAIGWALREYAKTDPEAVVGYVRRNAARLSPLSQREALRNVRSSHVAHTR
jgi:3-methyladenine DNA glycosylase AlkD